MLASKAYDGLNDPARAVAEAEAALQLDPRNEAGARAARLSFFSAGIHRWRRWRFSPTRSGCSRKSLVVRLGKGLALKELQRYDEAEKTLAACWPHPLAFDALATVLVQRDKFEEAKIWRHGSFRRIPQDYRGYYFLAAAKDGLQEKDAREALRQSLERKADFAASHALLGKIQLREGELEAAVASFEQAIRYRPDLCRRTCNWRRRTSKLGREAGRAAGVRDCARVEQRRRLSRSRASVIIGAVVKSGLQSAQTSLPTLKIQLQRHLHLAASCSRRR